MRMTSCWRGTISTLLWKRMKHSLRERSALKTTASVYQQTMQRVDTMKFLVLKAFDGEEQGAGKTGHMQYSRDITTKIVSLVQGRVAAVEQFKKAQGDSEFTLSDLRKRLATLRS